MRQSCHGSIYYLDLSTSSSPVPTRMNTSSMVVTDTPKLLMPNSDLDSENDTGFFKNVKRLRTYVPLTIQSDKELWELVGRLGGQSEGELRPHICHRRGSVYRRCYQVDDRLRIAVWFLYHRHVVTNSVPKNTGTQRSSNTLKWLISSAIFASSWRIRYIATLTTHKHGSFECSKLFTAPPYTIRHLHI